jgi:nucleotide-binding universal stress UspA family protein
MAEAMGEHSLSKGERRREEQIMYNKIMVPLDGSELAECVLPHVEALAKGCQAKEVILVRAFVPFQAVNIGGEYVPNEKEITRIDADFKAEAQDYLKKVTERLNLSGIAARWAVLTGKPSEILSDFAKADNCDLIIMATHGRSGVSRWVWGSIADRILRSACVPVLMVRAPGAIRESDCRLAFSPQNRRPPFPAEFNFQQEPLN